MAVSAELYNNIWNDFDKLRISDSVEQKISPIVTFNSCRCRDSPSVIEIDSTIVCENCGLVFEDSMISTEEEWRSFKNESGVSKNNSRTATIDPLAPKTSLSTVIGGGAESVRMRRLNMWLSMNNYEEKILHEFKNLLEKISSGSHYLSKSIINDTLCIYKKFYGDNKAFIRRGRNKTGIFAVCLYGGCIKNGNYISSTVVSELFNTDKTSFSKCYRLFMEMDTSNTFIDIEKRIVSPIDILKRSCNSLDVPYKVQSLCCKILEACEQLHIFPNIIPQSLASTVISFVNTELNLGISRDIISKICDISKITIVKYEKILQKHKKELFNLVKTLKNH